LFFKKKYQNFTSKFDENRHKLPKIDKKSPEIEENCRKSKKIAENRRKLPKIEENCRKSTKIDEKLVIKTLAPGSRKVSLLVDEVGHVTAVRGRRCGRHGVHLLKESMFVTSAVREGNF
jgi:hypothetical protein